MATTEQNPFDAYDTDAAISPVTDELSESPSSATTLPQESEPLASELSLPPHFIDSIGELKGLSAAISAFQECYDDLHNHLQSIKAAILAKLHSETNNVALHNSSALQNVDLREDRALSKEEDQLNLMLFELEDLCKTMNSRGIRKYLAVHLYDLDKIREELPKALMLSLDPAELVLGSLGKFYLQGKKAFTNKSPMNRARKTSIFILECFLLMIGLKLDGVLDIKMPVRAEAETAALAWRKRLIAEGGLDKVGQTDARGLLMFVACFGIPASFKRGDIRDLVMNANAKEITDVLRNSVTFMDKILEYVDDMIKNRMEVDAVDIVYTFGLEERFNPQAILTSFLRESKESGKKLKKMSQGSSTAKIEAKKKQLTSLTALVKCLKKHDVDAAKLIPGWQIKDNIANLERDIANAYKASGENPMLHKRKDIETFGYLNNQQAKRPHYSIHGPPHHHGAANVGSLENLRSFLEDGLQTLPSPHVVYGGRPGASLLPERVIPYGSYPIPSHSIPPGPPPPPYPPVLGAQPFVDSAGPAPIHPSYVYPDPLRNDRYSGQASSLGPASFYPNTTSTEEFAGGNQQGSGLDQHRFVDSVVMSEAIPSDHHQYS